MKKLTILSVLALAFAFTSCDFETQAFKDMRFQRDSIQHLQQTQLDELLNYMDIVQSVDSSFDAIRESQNMLSMVSYDESGKNSMKQRVQDNIYMISNLLAENNAKIAELEEKFNESDLKNTKLQKTINRLKKDLKAKNAEITKLYKELEAKNFRIDSLLVENQIVGQRAAELTALSEAQLAQLNAQDAALHTAYFFMGTRKELKANDINVKDKDSGYRTSLFTPVDVRTFDRLETDSKSAKILTKHPETSYELVRGADKKYTLIIKNPENFWNASKYLIIQIK
jgi:chromosome segregation ATPase